MLDSDRKNKELIKQAVEETKEAIQKMIESRAVDSEELKSLKECLVAIKLQLTTLQTNQESFIDYHKDRVDNCDRVHADYENRIRDNEKKTEKALTIPQRCEVNEKSLNGLALTIEKIQKSIQSLTNFKFKIVGAVLVISIIVPSIIGGITVVFMKNLVEKLLGG